jgi:hypothetical protein
MTADEFFTDQIANFEAFKINDELTFYMKTIGKVTVRVATLETHKGTKMLWVSYPEFYLPLIKFYNMKEDEVTEFIKSKLDVHLVGFMPSFHRFFQNETIHTEQNKLIQ